MFGLRPTPSRSPSAQRPARRYAASGFTLVELLTVIVILAILMSIGFKVMKYTSATQNMSKARAEMTVLLNALEEFKIKYGEYPPMDSSIGSGSPIAEQNLLLALSGRARWATNSSGVYTWETVPMSRQVNDGQSNPGFPDLYNWGKAFIDTDQFTIDKDNSTASGYAEGAIIHDPWWGDGIATDNGYLYRYKIIADIQPQPVGYSPSWQGKGPILVTRGPDQKPADANSNFVWKAVGTKSTNTGVIDNSYFDPSQNPDLSDNIILGAGVQTP
jgi:prepilin-type N-terminal cleavage/methylation domain-containing protein